MATDRQHGFTYVAALVMVAILGVIAAATAAVWHTERKRESEAELIFVGHQYRDAIGRYFERSPGPVKTFPRRLEDLLLDPRTPAIRRYLRTLYPDPISGRYEWGMIKGPNGEIVGIFSLSEGKPLKQGNFSRSDERLENRDKYSEWVFQYSPSRSSGFGVSPQVPAPTARFTRPANLK
jgi:type II secretory pathway pseudopilin PulG